MSSPAIIVFAACLICVALAGGSGVSERILNGSDIADIKDYPFAVAVRCRGVHVCGGAIIAPQFVLTSAECVKKCVLGEVSVHSGSKYLNRALTAHKPYQMIAHPHFSVKTKDFNVGLMKVPLSEKFEEFAPISITERDLASPSTATALGWGITSEGGEEHAAVLQRVEVAVTLWETCFNAYVGRPGINITFNMMCTSNADGKGTCEGDFGGPLVDSAGGKTVLVAVAISSSDFCARDDYPSVFIKLQNDVRQWIRTNAFV